MAFFIQSNNGSGDVYEMDATTEVTYSLSGNPTRYAVESGVNVSDHYQRSQPQVRFSGIVSDVKFSTPEGTIVTLADFERGLTDLQRSGEFFACTFSQNLDVLQNCLFRSLDIRTTTETGTLAREISFTIVQVEQAEQARVTVLPVPAERFKDVVEARSRGTGSTSEPNPVQNEDLTSTAEELLGVPTDTLRLPGG
tara:strand:- start:27100 stop:27687 length:588 start_codon:yes stop_codon:yes gene_type:complete